MVSFQTWVSRGTVLILLCGLATSCGFHRKKYENPITKDTQQPDKVLFDKSISDLERGRYEVARLTLQTLMNTYDTSEYLAKAKLAYADSWYREGGTHGLAQAEAEYKDFILFYPMMEEAAEAQGKVCMIHFQQMEKPDRDMSQALRAEEECRNVLVQFPNSKFATDAAQRLREIQEVLAEGEMRRGLFYHSKGSYPAAANRLQGVVEQYPLYSQADQANWELADSYSKMGPRFRAKAGESYARIVREYPLSPLVDDAKKKLQALEMPVPEADPVAYNRMKFELENREKMGMMGHAFGILKRGPDVRMAAKSGAPAMTSLRPSIPASVPPAAQTGTLVPELTGNQVTDSTTLENNPDARMAKQNGTSGTAATGTDASAAPAATAPAGSGTGETPAATSAPPATDDQQAMPTNHAGKPKKQKKQKKEAKQS